MIDYFNSLGNAGGGSSAGYIQFAENRGIDMSGIPDSEINRIWDMASEGVDDDVESPILLDGITIYDRADAYRWLQSKVNEYGSTSHFPTTERIKLNTLIERFGNTYFWRR